MGRDELFFRVEEKHLWWLIVSPFDGQVVENEYDGRQIGCGQAEFVSRFFAVELMTDDDQVRFIQLEGGTGLASMSYFSRIYD